MKMTRYQSYTHLNEIRMHWKFNLLRTNVCKYIVAAKSFQSCPTLYDPIDGSPPGSRIPGILQAKTLKRVAISFFNA